MYKVAILGTGKMGSAMARELSSAGAEIALWNRSRQKAEDLALELANPLVKVAATVAEAFLDTDIAICAFTDGKVTQNVLLSDPKLLELAESRLIIVDMGTSGVESAKYLDQEITKAGLRFVDAPVSGSVATIAAHQLLVMASGSPDGVEEIRPVLDIFAKKVAYLGHAGSGQALKLSVNLIVHSLNAAVSEALALATSVGISASDVYDVFEESVIAAPFVKYKRSAFLDGKTPVAMRMDTVVKDMGLIRNFGASTAVPLNAAWAVEDLYRHACAAGFEASDMASLVRYLKP